MKMRTYRFPIIYQTVMEIELPEALARAANFKEIRECASEEIEERLYRNIPECYLTLLGLNFDGTIFTIGDKVVAMSKEK